MKLTAENIAVRYAALSRLALDGVSVEAPQGSITAVVGPNGSGKSTLMRALLGVAPLERGRVTLDDRPLGTWDRRELARAVGVVPQSESVNFPLTVRELAAMGRYPHLGPLQATSHGDRGIVARSLEVCHVLDLADRDVATLSGGELQRARVARALASEPRALVLDEPTASLDVRHEMEILELLRSSADVGITVLIITHGLDTVAQFADRMVLLSAGRVAAEGTPGQVMREDVLREVYGWPISVSIDSTSGAPRVTPVRAPRK